MLDGRKLIKKRVKELYGLRSKLSHGGVNRILDSDLRELRELAVKVLIRMIKKSSQFREQHELSQWIEEQKLT
jgi:hypothetical protein